MYDISILTHVMRREHIAFLEDWLEFINWKPDTLIVVTGIDPRIAESLRLLCDTRGIRFKNIITAEPIKLKEDETFYLRRQFAACETSLAIVIKLDTFPYRAGHEDWLNDLIIQMMEEKALFITGSTLPYRSDTASSGRDIMRTTRVSNNFLIINPKKWISLQALEGEPSTFGRYETEGSIEAHCSKTGEFGLRRINTPTWRVFHIQVWDARMSDIRDRFRRGAGILPFLNGYQDDLYHPWEQYYMTAPPNTRQLLKIWLGGIRRRPIGEVIRLIRRTFPKNWVGKAVKQKT